MTNKGKKNNEPGKGGGKEQETDRRDDEDKHTEPSRAVLAIQPTGNAIAVAVDKQVRVYDKRGGKLHILLGTSATAAPDTSSVVRCVAFSRCGRFLAAGGDNKYTHLWSTDSWKSIKTFKAPKKINVVNFSREGAFLLAANKFGDVLVTSTAAPVEGETPYEILLGHYCSVLTSLELSHDGSLLATTDRDAKVRFSKMHSNLLEGAHEIQSFGFGHTDFVSCSVFVRQGEAEVLISGGGDGTLRMWNPEDGRQMCEIQIGGKQEEGKRDETADSPQASLPCPVLALCPSKDGKYLVVALDATGPLTLIKVDIEQGELELHGQCALPGLPFTTDICRDESGKFIFIGGPLPGSNGTAAVLESAALSGDGTSLELASSEMLNADIKQQLQGCNKEELVGIVPQKILPKYLHKRPFEYDEEKAAARKAKAAKVEAGVSDGAAAQGANVQD